MSTSPASVRERPILFSASMVRAILEGRKTQTRRVVKPQPPARNDMINAAYCGHPNLWLPNGSICADTPREWRCPYGQPGDQLWVRETWALHDQGFDTAEESTFPIYRADKRRPEPKRWRPSIHMPRWASRITLEVTSVRVERLQAISTTDAEAEGLVRFPFEDSFAWAWRDGDRSGHASPTGAFRNLWCSIKGAGSWDDNPWVWVVEFKRIGGAA